MRDLLDIFDMRYSTIHNKCDNLNLFAYKWCAIILATVLFSFFFPSHFYCTAKIAAEQTKKNTHTQQSINKRAQKKEENSQEVGSRVRMCVKFSSLDLRVNLNRISKAHHTIS